MHENLINIMNENNKKIVKIIMEFRKACVINDLPRYNVLLFGAGIYLVYVYTVDH